MLVDFFFSEKGNSFLQSLFSRDDSHREKREDKHRQIAREAESTKSPGALVCYRQQITKERTHCAQRIQKSLKYDNLPGNNLTTSSYHFAATSSSPVTGDESQTGSSCSPSTAHSMKTKGDNSDPSYKEKRERNNEAVKKSREKKKIEMEKTAESVARLEREHRQLEEDKMLMEVRYQTIKEMWTENFGPLDAATETSLFDS